MTGGADLLVTGGDLLTIDADRRTSMPTPLISSIAVTTSDGQVGKASGQAAQGAAFAPVKASSSSATKVNCPTIDPVSPFPAAWASSAQPSSSQEIFLGKRQRFRSRFTKPFSSGTIHGGAGDDVLTQTYAGDATVYGDAGNDFLAGGSRTAPPRPTDPA